MKKSRTFIGLFIIFVMLFSNTAYASSGNNDEVQGADALKQKIESMQRQEAEFLASEEVQKNNAASEAYRALEERICIDEAYPDYYGGAYINDNNELVVILTEQSEELVQMIKDTTSASKATVVIDYSNVSLAYLKALQKNYDAKMLYLVGATQLSELEEAVLDNMVGVSLDISAGELAIRMKDVSDEKIEAFKKVFGDDKYTRFEISQEVSLTASWYIGNELYVSGKGYLTTGYRAYYMNDAGVRKNGFVTAGHGCAVGDKVYGVTSSGNVVLGTCRRSMFTGSVDAAFIEITNSSYTMVSTTSSALASKSILTSTYVTSSDITKGKVVYSFGIASGLLEGEILDTSESVVYEDEDTGQKIYMVDLVVMSNKTKDGDSGGCVCVIKNGGYVTAGTMSGRDPFYDTTLKSYFSKIYNQVSALNIVRY